MFGLILAAIYIAVGCAMGLSLPAQFITASGWLFHWFLVWALLPIVFGVFFVICGLIGVFHGKGNEKGFALATLLASPFVAALLCVRNVMMCVACYIGSHNAVVHGQWQTGPLVAMGIMTFLYLATRMFNAGNLQVSK